MKKQLIAAALVAWPLFSLAGGGLCPTGSGSEAKDYSQIIHDARTEEENKNMMIVRPGDGEGSFTAMDGYSSEMTADDINSQTESMILPMLGLEEGDWEDFAVSLSLMNIRSYAVAIVKPAEDKTDDVRKALESYVTSQQLSMENYLADQYEIAKAATVKTVPSGEVVLVCCEDADSVLASIEKALAA